MRLLITGDREWASRRRIKTKLIEIGCPGNIEVLIHGAARGADTIASEVAIELGLPESRIQAFPAKWGKLGRIAGPIRNRRMLLEGPTQVLAFHDHIAKSKGTVDMVKISRKAGVPVWCSWE